MTDKQIDEALLEAYKQAGHNAYFGNGFEAGVKFTLEQINLSLVKEIKTRKTNHMTALRTYKPGSEEAINLKARISECQQIISIINDLNKEVF